MGMMLALMMVSGAAPAENPLATDSVTLKPPVRLAPGRGPLAWPPTIRVSDAAEHVGKSVQVAGTVTGRFVNEKVGFIHFGGDHDRGFYAVCFGDGRRWLAQRKRSEIVGRSITLLGKVQLYRGRPQIVIQSRWQIDATVGREHRR